MKFTNRNLIDTTCVCGEGYEDGSCCGWKPEKSTKMTKNGVTTTTGLGQEQYERFKAGSVRAKKFLVQYDYRHTNGALFSCIAGSLAIARSRRDLWLKEQGA